MLPIYEPERVAVSGGVPGVVYAKVPFPGLAFYCVGSDGSVWSRWSGAWRPLSTFPVSSGHLGVNVILAHGQRRRAYVHWLVCQAFYGPCPGDEYEACHDNGDKHDNRASNIRWAKQSENNYDRMIHRSQNEGY